MSVFEALADPTRRRIVELLADRERTAGQIAAEFSISRPAVSRHLRVLREAGIADATDVAQSRLYRLNDEALTEAERWLHDTRALWLRRLGLLERHLESRRGQS
jgi:DNA-binding transcriptional ArsR family regulator